MSRYSHSDNPPSQITQSNPTAPRQISQSNPTAPSQTSQSNPTAPSQTSQSNFTAPRFPSFIAPVLVHANYCGDKVTCFNDRGLWLLNDDTYTIGNQSFFASDGRDHSSGSGGGNEAVVGGGGGSRGGTSLGYNHRVCRVYDIEHTKYRKPQWYVMHLTYKQQKSNLHLHTF